jgi:starch synthase
MSKRPTDKPKDKPAVPAKTSTKPRKAAAPRKPKAAAPAAAVATRVLAAVSEIYPLVKTGGLADVAGALPLALAKIGVQVRSLVPGYPAVMQALTQAEPVLTRDNLFGGPARVLAATVAGLDLLVLDAPHLYDRPGGPYVDQNGRDWWDNPVRFAALSRIAADIGLGALPGWTPDVVHCHDWQTALAVAYLHYAGDPRPRTVMTVHNLAFTGQVPVGLRETLGLPPESLTMDGVEFYGAIGYLKAGLRFADVITTVSPTYAQEIQTPEYGCGFDGLLRTRRDVLHGILNGIDTDVWNPETDPHLVSRYSAKDLTGRAPNKPWLQERMGLTVDPAALLYGVVTRLTTHKGMDRLLVALPALLATGAQLALVGTGDPALEAGFRAAALAHPGRVGVVIGYDEALAHQMQAGIDALLMPSRFEPCGLTQMCALRYGAVPVVSRVGGLADSVIDANEAAVRAGVATGVVLSGGGVAGLESGLVRARALWGSAGVWAGLTANAVKQAVGWEAEVGLYAEVFARG